MHFSWNVSMRFRKIKIMLTLCLKQWWTGHTFCPYFSSFRANRKSMLTILKINVLVDMMLQTMDKTVSYLQKTQFFVLGHVTLSVSWWRHQPAYIYTLNLLSEFDQIKARLCQVMANWFFPSNGPKRYCNGPLMDYVGPLIERFQSSSCQSTALSS